MGWSEADRRRDAEIRRRNVVLFDVRATMYTRVFFGSHAYDIGGESW